MDTHPLKERDTVSGFSIICSPAKKMRVLEGPPYPETTPRFMERTQELARAVHALTLEEAQTLWKVSDVLARENYDRFQNMDLTSNTTAAAIAYVGIQYQHLAAEVASAEELDYLRRHLRILSGFYGVVTPTDGVVPYRLEMQARLQVGECKNLYDYWSDTIARSIAEESGAIVNVASQEYAKVVVPHAKKLGLTVVTCIFAQRSNGRLRQVSTEAKATRGVFSRWCAEKGIEDVSDLKGFSERTYCFDEMESTGERLVFVREAPTRR